METARSTTGLAMALVLMTLVAFPAVAEEPQHGGSMANTHNDIYIVQGSADNPQEVDAGYDHVVVRETISFENDDPLKVPDYGIVYVDPRFTIQEPAAKVTAFTWDYNVSNYTLQLYNETAGYWGNFTGIVNESHSLAPGTDLNPDEPEQPHPRVNATYVWQVKVVSTEGSEIQTFSGGEVHTGVFNDTVFDLTPLGLPPLGENSHEADEDELYDLWTRAFLEPHPSLKAGFYRFRITDMVFEYGMALTIEVRYIGEMNGGRTEMDKLIFMPRITHTDVYHEGDVEVLMYSNVGGEGSQIAPDSVSTGPGVPTRYTTEDTFSLVIREEGTEGTDWGLYGRYALLGLLIAALLVLVLWSGPRRKGAGEGDDEEEEVEEDEETAARRAELEAEKRALLERIKELDRRHEDGELGTGVWNRKRRSLKAKAVDVIKELKELDEAGESHDDDDDEHDGEAGDDEEGEEKEEEEDEETATRRAELEAEKRDLLERIQELDRRHEEGDLGIGAWTRKRRSLKARAVEVVKELKELDKAD